MDPRMIAPQCFSLSAISIEYENKWFFVKNRGGYYTVETEYPQVGVLPIMDNHSLILVRVKRPVIADIPFEIPGGSVEELETPVFSAARELYEETGINIKELSRFQLLPPLSLSSTRRPVLEYIYKVNISQSEFDKKEPYDNEIVSVECLSFEAVKDRIIKGEIYVGLSVAIISRFLLSIR